MSKLVKTDSYENYSLVATVNPGDISQRLYGDPTKEVWFHNVRLNTGLTQHYGDVYVEEITPLAIKHTSGRLLIIWREE